MHEMALFAENITGDQLLKKNMDCFLFSGYQFSATIVTNN